MLFNLFVLLGGQKNQKPSKLRTVCLFLKVFMRASPFSGPHTYPPQTPDFVPTRLYNLLKLLRGTSGLRLGLRVVPSIILLLLSTAYAQERISLKQALDESKIAVQVRGAGGFSDKCIQILVKNLTAQAVSLEILPGQVFVSEDTTKQDLMATSPAYVALGPGQSKGRSVYGMCIQSGSMSPAKGERFTLGDMAEGDLLGLAERIAEGGYQNSTAQSAVWTVANREPVQNIFGEDTAMVRDIATYVSEATGIPINEFVLTPRVHHITEINTSLEALIPHKLNHAKLVLTDEDGGIVRRYFDERSYERGFRQWTVGANHHLGDSAKLWLRLYEGEVLIAEKTVTFGDTVLDLDKVHAEAVMVTEVREDTYATIGVYDENDDLFVLLAENKHFPKGIHRGRYIVGSPLPFDKTYSIKIKADGQTLSEQVLNTDAPEPIIYPVRTVSGRFDVKIEEPIAGAQVAIYDEQGRVKHMMYKIHHLNPGSRWFSYKFEHRDGPDAKFYIRLTDKEGKIISEKLIGSR